MVFELIPVLQKNFHFTTGKTKKYGVNDVSIIKNEQYCRVVLLDNTDLDVVIDKHVRGAELLDKVCQRLNLIEKDYFGLSFNKKSHYSKDWLQLDKSISKQIKKDPWTFWFEVKFYPVEPSTLKDDLTRSYLCLQIRNDIISGKLPCSIATHVLLGSFLMQSQFGNYDPNVHGLAEAYLSDFSFAPNQTSDILNEIYELHKSHKGMTSQEAELQYLENAKKLAMYGVDLHEAKDNNNAKIFLGVCANGLLVYRGKLRINRFAWPKIVKISFRRQYFSLKLRPTELDPTETKVIFKMENDRAAERLWKTCVEHHTFFRLVSPETPPKKKFLRFGSTRYRFHGRTQIQSQLFADSSIDKVQFNGRRTVSVSLADRNFEHDSGDSTDCHKVSKSNDEQIVDSVDAETETLPLDEQNIERMNRDGKEHSEKLSEIIKSRRSPAESAPSITTTSSYDHKRISFSDNPCLNETFPQSRQSDRKELDLDVTGISLVQIRDSLTEQALKRISKKRKERYESYLKHLKAEGANSAGQLPNPTTLSSMAFDFMVLEGTPKRAKASKNARLPVVVQQTRNFLQGAAEPPTPPFFKTSTPTKLTLCSSPNYLHTTDDSELHEKSTVSTNVNNRIGFSPAFSPNEMTSSDSKSSGVKSNAVSQDSKSNEGVVMRQKKSRSRKSSSDQEDQRLSAAILEATQFNQEWKVEKVELKRKD